MEELNNAAALKDDAKDRNRCRAINVFFPVLIVAYVGMSLVFAIVVQSNKIVLPAWAPYVVSQFFVLLPAVLYILIFRQQVPKEISYRLLKPLDVLFSLLIGYTLIPMVLFIGNLSMLFSTNHLQESATELTQFPFFLQIIVIAVIPPIVEEFIFRGLFYHTYRKMGILAGAIASGLIFGLFHLNINQFCYACVMGVVFAYMVEATGSMWASMLAHFAVNTYSISMMALARYLTAGSAEFERQYESAQNVAQNLSMETVIMQLFTLGLTAAGFMFLAVIMIRKMAKRNGRLERMRIFANNADDVSNVENVNNVEKTDRDEINPKGAFKKIVSWPAIATAVFCVIYMIIIELQ